MEKLNKQYLKQLSHYSWLTLIAIISILGVSAVFYLLAILFSGHIEVEAGSISIDGGNLVSTIYAGLFKRHDGVGTRFLQYLHPLPDL